MQKRLQARVTKLNCNNIIKVSGQVLLWIVELLYVEMLGVLLKICINVLSVVLPNSIHIDRFCKHDNPCRLITPLQEMNNVYMHYNPFFHTNLIRYTY